MTTTCPYTVSQALRDVLSEHIVACSNKITTLNAEIETSTALENSLQTQSTTLSSEEQTAIEALANLFGSNSELVAAVTELLLNFKQQYYADDITAAHQATVEAQAEQTEYTEKCAPFPVLDQAVREFMGQLVQMNNNAQEQVSGLSTQANQAIADYEALANPPAPESIEANLVSDNTFDASDAALAM